MRVDAFVSSAVLFSSVAFCDARVCDWVSCLAVVNGVGNVHVHW